LREIGTLITSRRSVNRTGKTRAPSRTVSIQKYSSFEGGRVTNKSGGQKLYALHDTCHARALRRYVRTGPASSGCTVGLMGLIKAGAHCKAHMGVTRPAGVGPPSRASPFSPDPGCVYPRRTMLPQPVPHVRGESRARETACGHGHEAY
jgi:hypothetical protein